ncbi:MAG: formate/nitrite transporter family protein [Proteobacteria bacterium]|nr:formate/nitrite transporter family protein [Pseudomonadota bacterium]
MSESPSIDAYSPADVAARVRDVGVAKVRRDRLGMFALAVLAGAFIALGAVLFTVVVTGSTLGFGVTRLIGGGAFSLGLILVVIAGAELFTGNNLVAMAWASRLITFREVVTHWVIVYVGNLVGALATVGLVVVGQVHAFGGGGVGTSLRAIATHKLGLDLLQAFALGVLCNGLVCLAVWLSLAARSVTDKVLAIVFPIAGFVAIGFEHSIANMVFLPWDLAVHGADRAAVVATLANLAVVTLGNIVGGTVLVAGVYWTIYLRPKPR